MIYIDLLVVVSFLLDCSAIRSRNSFCFASNDWTPSGVMSEMAGVRARIELLAKGRTSVAGAGKEAGALRRRRAYMVMAFEGVDEGKLWLWLWKLKKVKGSAGGCSLLIQRLASQKHNQGD